MRRRWFIGKSQAWLEAELSKAQDDLAAGTTNIGGQAGDSSFTEQQTMDPQQRIDALLLELTYVAPETYPPASIRGKRVTKGVFYTSFPSF
jgi:hypothetical protein